MTNDWTEGREVRDRWEHLAQHVARAALLRASRTLYRAADRIRAKASDAFDRDDCNAWRMLLSDAKDAERAASELADQATDMQLEAEAWV